jgi:hypothetical protein
MERVINGITFFMIENGIFGYQAWVSKKLLVKEKSNLR